MRAARVVADHAAERAAAVRGRIGSERELMRLGGVAQRIEHDARLDARESRWTGSISRIRFMYFVKSSTTATLQHWPARLVPAPRGRTGAPYCAARRHRRDHIVGVARDDEADRNLAVVGAVGRVERAAAAIEPHLAANLALQRAFEIGGRRERHRSVWRVS